MSKVLVEIEPELWGRVRARALEECVVVAVVVGRALRGELAGHHDGSVAGTRAVPAAAADAGFVQEMATPSAPNEALRRVATASRADAVFGVGETIAASEHVFEGGERVIKGKPSVEDLKRLVSRTTGARVGSGRDVAEGTMLDAAAPTDPSRVKATVEKSHALEKPHLTDLAVESERQRIARQNHLRTAPEDESQDDERGPGF